jgi:hypothetical protein
MLDQSKPQGKPYSTLQTQQLGLTIFLNLFLLTAPRCWSDAGQEVELEDVLSATAPAMRRTAIPIALVMREVYLQGQR